jgi:hypothetical protein
MKEGFTVSLEKEAEGERELVWFVKEGFLYRKLEKEGRDIERWFMV